MPGDKECGIKLGEGIRDGGPRRFGCQPSTPEGGAQVKAELEGAGLKRPQAAASHELPTGELEDRSVLDAVLPLVAELGLQPRFHVGIAESPARADEPRDRRVTPESPRQRQVINAPGGEPQALGH